jgi:hypothetical protein
VDFEQALTAELESISGLGGKVFPLNATEGTKPPYLIYVTSEGLRDKTLDGYLESREIDYELNILSATYTGLKPLITEVISKILSFQSRVIGTNGPYVQNVTYEEPVELYEAQVNWYRCNIQIRARI